MKKYLYPSLLIITSIASAADSRYDLDVSMINWTVGSGGSTASGLIPWNYTSGDPVFGSSFTSTVNVSALDTPGYFFTVGSSLAGTEILELGGPWVPSGTTGKIEVEFDSMWSAVPTSAPGYTFVAGEWNQRPGKESYGRGSGGLTVNYGVGNGSIIENNPVNGGFSPAYGLNGGSDIDAGASMQITSSSWSNSGSESISLGAMNGYVEFDRVPEPSSAMLALGAGALALLRRRR